MKIKDIVTIIGLAGIVYGTYYYFSNRKMTRNEFVLQLESLNPLLIEQCETGIVENSWFAIESLRVFKGESDLPIITVNVSEANPPTDVAQVMFAVGLDEYSDELPLAFVQRAIADWQLKSSIGSPR